MDALRLYMDDNNDLWIFFSDDYSSHIGAPFLYCFDSRTMKLKKDVRLFSDKGTPVTSPYDPLFVSHDQQGNFILATDLAYLTKVDQQGRKIYRKRLIEYHSHWTTRNQKRRRPYFVRDIQRQGDHEHDGYGKGSVGSLHMLSMAYSKSHDLIFVGQHCQCDPNDVVVYSGNGEYRHHFGAPAGPQTICERDGLLYLADHYHCFVHIYTYDGQWVRTFDPLSQDRFQYVYYLEDGIVRRNWSPEKSYSDDERYNIASLATLGEDKLAIGMEGGIVRVLNQDGSLLCDIEPPVPGSYPNCMVADSFENLFVYYTGDAYFNKPRGLYRYGADGKIRGPLLRGELGIFQPKQKALEKSIFEDCADAYDYFELADIQIRRERLSQETIRLLEKALDMKPDLWIALAYLGLSLEKLGETQRAIDCMERAMEHMGCSVMATALIEFYYHNGNQEKVWHYFKRMEAAEDDFDIEFYSSELTNDQIEQFLGPLVKRNKRDNLVSS